MTASNSLLPPACFFKCTQILLCFKGLYLQILQHVDINHLLLSSQVAPTTEIVLVPITGKGGQYPGLYIFTTPTRLYRPVRNLALQETEYIGTFEQVYMDIAVTPSEIHEKVCRTLVSMGIVSDNYR